MEFYLSFVLLVTSLCLQVSLATKCHYSVQKCKRENYCTDAGGLFSQSEKMKEAGRDFFMCIKSTVTVKGKRKNGGENFMMKVRVGISEKEYMEEFERQNNFNNLFSIFGKKTKFSHDKKCTPFPNHGAPRKVRDQVRRFSDDATILNIDACACKKNYCNGVPLHLLNLTSAFIGILAIIFI